MTEEQKMLSGEYYNGLDPQLAEKRERAQKLCMHYNQTCGGRSLPRDPQNHGSGPATGALRIHKNALLSEITDKSVDF